jgi:hypothetical protein
VGHHGFLRNRSRINIARTAANVLASGYFDLMKVPLVAGLTSPLCLIRRVLMSRSKLHAPAPATAMYANTSAYNNVSLPPLRIGHTPRGAAP